MPQGALWPPGEISPMSKRMKYRAIIIALVLAFVATSAFGQGHGYRGGRGPGPYGGYCEGPRWGWYGARQPVANIDEARKRLEKFYEGQGVVIGAMTEQGMFFKAEIKDRDGTLLDQVIIHKRSGRIRSTF